MTRAAPRAQSTQDSACPKRLGKANAHFWLVQRMAKTAGLDLAKAVEAGLLRQDDWASMVQCCRGCAWADGCEHWLDTADQNADAPPVPCLNRTRMARLKEALAVETEADVA
ncbi:hypothetical protein Dshi_2621 [Dinoroseobacter shibae DFL 12 = DSM 16493]|jgi:hypothetical protein|uniref:DUF6455 domain-containing protein n=1 Tax=Dinoroseobacter shibae (strain DSM 16493 / NCIMB 14021 / DFL 12) TaxID=398580 RepID=A8LI20_DINSH|nr:MULTISPECIES: DUF6455 family protein [Dinoroseobacter]ABV94354.1 hypothetical protein Dshi_2621 [Dinoroseobacter shibae DFL 12 = DSM 16493]MDD9717682.1 DUF6455 family protein [Dinoroseobacter sp. PD6]URF45785.1 DUF6455 family protein [Dinoroseobacter shibae]URF50091.1 DUF6455 family protein [Dinoroseobacter shibae]